MTNSYYAIYAIDKPNLAALRETLREPHREYIRAPNPDAVETVLGGPLLDDQGRMNGTLLVVRAGTREAAERFLAADPYSLAGLFERVELRAWRWGLGEPAAAGTPS